MHGRVIVITIVIRRIYLIVELIECQTNSCLFVRIITTDRRPLLPRSRSQSTMQTYIPKYDILNYLDILNQTSPLRSDLVSSQPASSSTFYQVIRLPYGRPCNFWGILWSAMCPRNGPVSNVYNKQPVIDSVGKRCRQPVQNI